MKRISLFLLLAAGMMLTAPSAKAANPILAFRGGFHGGHTRVIITGGWGWGWGLGWGWGWGYPGYGYEPYRAAYYGPPVWTRVKTDVEPEEARLYLDGQLIGTADDFDGWPDYLYLGRGRFRLEFRLNGYETKTVEVDARPGETLQIKNKLKKTPGAKRYGSYEEPRIEGGIHRFWVKRRDMAEPAEPYARRDGDRYRGDDRDEDRPAAAEPAPSEKSWRGRPADAPARAPRAQAGSTRSRLQLSVEPPDAAVYVDDRFVGTAAEVGSLERGVAVAPGVHTVTVSRPGFKDQSVEVEVKSGESEKVEISLEK